MSGRKAIQLPICARDFVALGVACGIAHIPLKTIEFDEQTQDYTFALSNKVSLRGNTKKGFVILEGPRYDGSSDTRSFAQSITKAYDYLCDDSRGAV